MVEIHSIIDKKTGKIIEEKSNRLRNGDTAIVKFVPTKPMCVEVFAEFPPLGRFVVRDMMQIVAVGVVKEVVKKDP